MTTPPTASKPSQRRPTATNTDDDEDDTFNTTSESQLLPPRPTILPLSSPNPITGNDDTPSPPSTPSPDPQSELPLSLSTSLLLHHPTNTPLPARQALQQLATTLDPPDQKVQIRFHAIGSAPQLGKQKVFKISASSKFGSVVNFLRKRLGLGTSPAIGVGTAAGPEAGGLGTKQVAGLFCYVNSVFAPGLDEGVGNLWRCFRTDEVLIVAYSVTPAFG